MLGFGGKERVVKGETFDLQVLQVISVIGF
jgi:hypothetical protein